ncbi:MAG: hypothetical protein AAGE59_05405 [Cyanobacteria bacterium P01_F01_bin.86]
MPLIFMHHPPFKTGIAMMDKIGLAGSEDLAQLVRQYPCIERVSCGHIHRTIYRRWAGTIASTQPSLVHQVVLNLQPEAIGTFAMEPPAYQLHIWDDNDLTSHTVYVDHFEGPYRFPDGQRIELCL